MGTIFGRKLLNVKCVSEISLIVRRFERDSFKNVHCSSCKSPIILVRFERNLNIPNGFSKSPQIKNFIKIRPLKAELFYADGETSRQADRDTDKTKLIVTFRNSAKVPRNGNLRSATLVGRCRNSRNGFADYPSEMPQVGLSHSVIESRKSAWQTFTSCIYLAWYCYIVKHFLCIYYQINGTIFKLSYPCVAYLVTRIISKVVQSHSISHIRAFIEQSVNRQDEH